MILEWPGTMWSTRRHRTCQMRFGARKSCHTAAAFCLLTFCKNVTCCSTGIMFIWKHVLLFQKITSQDWCWQISFSGLWHTGDMHNVVVKLYSVCTTGVKLCQSIAVIWINSIHDEPPIIRFGASYPTWLTTIMTQNVSIISLPLCLLNRSTLLRLVWHERLARFKWPRRL